MDQSFIVAGEVIDPPLQPESSHISESLKICMSSGTKVRRSSVPVGYFILIIA